MVQAWPTVIDVGSTNLLFHFAGHTTVCTSTMRGVAMATACSILSSALFSAPPLLSSGVFFPWILVANRSWHLCLWVSHVSRPLHPSCSWLRLWSRQNSHSTPDNCADFNILHYARELQPIPTLCLRIWGHVLGQNSYWINQSQNNKITSYFNISSPCLLWLLQVSGQICLIAG